MESTSKSQLQKFYSNKNVFITGGSSFFGKLLIIKILKSCPDVKGIYLLLHKEDQILEILQNQIFDTLHNEIPGFPKKLHTIIGNIQYKNLSLMVENQEFLKNEINIVFHLDETKSLNEKLSVAIEINIRGTMELLNLCKEMKQLESVMIASSCYSFPQLRYSNDTFNVPTLSSEILIQMVENIPHGIINKLTPKLLGYMENTYCFTKSSMENGVKEYIPELPVGLIKFSNVTSTYKFPIEGWIENCNIPIELTAAVISGELHVLNIYKNITFDFVPGDYCVNAILATAYDVSLKFKFNDVVRRNDIIYNFISGKNAIKISDVYKIIDKIIPIYPFEKMFWVNFLIFNEVYLYDNIHIPFISFLLEIFLEFIPAIICDGFNIICNKNRRYLQRSIDLHKKKKLLRPFTKQQKSLTNSNITKLWEDMSLEDKKQFPFDTQNIDWPLFYKGHVKGIKEFIMKEEITENSLFKCKLKYKVYLFLHYFLIFILFFGLYYVLSHVLSF